MLWVELGDDELVRISLHVVVVPGLEADVGRLLTIEVDKGKSFRVLRILVD